MRLHAALALLLVPACFEDAPPVDDDDAADATDEEGDDSSSGGESSGEPSVDCEQGFRDCVCVTSPGRPELCIEPYFECSPEATAIRDACIEAEHQCESDCGACSGGDSGCISTRNLCLSMCDGDCEPSYPECG